MLSNDLFHSMGVLNLTPDSFSDGGKLTTSEQVLKQINKMKIDECTIFDFGAESTAPFNQVVSLEEELSRFEKFLYPIIDQLDKQDIISIDTYKVEVMQKLLESGIFDDRKLIFNDVSGALDSRLEELLLKNPKLIYVYSHNLAPSRDLTQSHMEYLCPHYSQDLLKHMSEYFEEADSWFKEKGIESTVWFDPCFGFSKDYQQNLELLEAMPRLMDGLGVRTWLLGISKKSFLRKLTASSLPNEEQFKRAEQAHAAILSSWFSEISQQNQVVIRLHDVSLFQSVKRCKFLYES